MKTILFICLAFVMLACNTNNVDEAMEESNILKGNKYPALSWEEIHDDGSVVSQSFTNGDYMEFLETECNVNSQPNYTTYNVVYYADSIKVGNAKYGIHVNANTIYLERNTVSGFDDYQGKLRIILDKKTLN